MQLKLWQVSLCSKGGRIIPTGQGRGTRSRGSIPFHSIGLQNQNQKNAPISVVISPARSSRAIPFFQRPSFYLIAFMMSDGSPLLTVSCMSHGWLGFRVFVAFLH